MTNILIYSNNQMFTEKIKIILAERSERMNVYYSESVTGLLLFNLTMRNMHIIIMRIQNKKDILAAQRFKVYNYKSLIIFYAENEDIIDDLRMIESFRCLIKPDGPPELEKALDDAFERLALQQTELFTYKKNKSRYGINLDNVMYFFSTHKTVHFKCASGLEEEFSGKLDDVQKQVENKCNTFLRVSKSYYVNKKYIIHEFPDSIKMSDGMIATISRDYRDIQAKICEFT